MAETLTTTTEELTRAVWSTASANDLPDSAFAYIEPGGKKDEDGKTTPRSLRHLPYKNADGKVDPAHVRNALARLSQTQIPEAAKASARRKLVAAAKSVGVEVSDDDNKERSMGTDDTLTRAAANHEPMTGKHSHPHPAFNSQGDDEMHEHEHSHDNDADHGHEHAERAAGSDTPVTPETLSLYAPIVRTDKDEWVIEGQVTSDAVDHYGTIFDYEASKEAFATWRGNIREQHDSKKAVGRAIEVIPDDANRCIYLRARISRGARDTWEKILDGTLSGFSVGADPRHVETTSIVRNGKNIPVYRVKKWNEVSVVDNPGSPGCDVAIVRADGVLTDIIDTSEEETPPVPESVISSSGSSLERAGARVSSSTRDAMHDSIGHTLKAAHSQMQNCGCDGCAAAMKMLDPDEDGDIDFGGFADTDNDAESLYSSDDGMDRAVMAAMERALPAAIERALGPVYMRLQGIAGQLSRSYAQPQPTFSEDTLTSAITRAVESATSSSLAEVRASQGAVKEQVDAIARQVKDIADTPVPGAPVMHANSLPRPVEKRLPTDPYQMPVSRGATADAVAALWNAGQLDTTEKQVDAVAAALAAQRRGR